MYVKELDIFLTLKVLDNTPAVLSLGKLCDENGYSYEWINGQKPHFIKDGIRIICNTENFVPIVVPGLSSSSSGSSSALRTPMKQESHSSSSSSSSSSPTVNEIQIREREDATNSDISPDVVGVVTHLVGGVAQAFHGDQVVEVRVQLAVQEVEGKEEDRKGQVEVEEEKRLKEVRSWMTMEMFMTRLRS